MLKHNPQSETQSTDEVALANVVEQMADEHREHGSVDLTAWQARYPEFASEFARLVPTLGALADFSSAGDQAQAAHDEELLHDKTLGDFRIVHELGRGGMGIVYEAEQLSLNRRVALKILPMAAVLDPRTLQRFKNEAQAAAALDHPHIVDVYGVGCERGIHYYAMRLIEGCTLADVIAERIDRGQGAAVGVQQAESSKTKSKIQNLKSAADTASLALLSTEPVGDKGPFFRAVAELGIRVAEGLNHAHEQGVVHRDIKPSNLMLDGQGKVWITDFGLARIETGENLTHTGDLLGTLRYMSPEQALANRAPIDQRSDIYSLGATLYELLTLQPVFGESERAALLQTIGTIEPTTPRKLNPQIPADLETVVLKMLDKEPQRRYASAADLALDLRRFVENKPIVARRPTLAQRLAKWSARNRALVATAATMLVVIASLAGGILGWWGRDSAARRQIAQRIAGEAQKAAAKFRQEGNWLAALSELRRAEAALAPLSSQSKLAVENSKEKRDAEMAVKLDDIRLLRTMLAGSDFDFHAADEAYQKAFAEYGIPVATLDGARATRLVRQSAIRVQLAAALTDWSLTRKKNNVNDERPDWRHFLAIAREADPDPWRSRLRKAWIKEELSQMATSPALEKQPAATQFLFVTAAMYQRANNEAMQTTIQQIQRLHANDFWVNFAVARYFENTEPPQWDEAVRFYSVAAGLRPIAAAVHNNLGTVLQKQGRRKEAIAEYRRAIEFSPDAFFPYANLGLALAEEDQVEAAVTAFRKAIDLNGDAASIRKMLEIVAPKSDLVAALIREL